MEILNSIDLELYPKILITLSGLVALFIKLRDSLSSLRRKQELKVDLEIYELAKKNELDRSEIKAILEERLNHLTNNKGDGLTNFLTGIAVFVGFGLWSIDIFQKSSNFNGWIILTIACSLIGLTLLLGKPEEREKKGVFLVFHFYDRTNYQFGIFITILCGILTPILIVKIESFSFWQFLTGLFFFIGIFSLVKNTKIKRP